MDATVHTFTHLKGFSNVEHCLFGFELVATFIPKHTLSLSGSRSWVKYTSLCSDIKHIVEF